MVFSVFHEDLKVKTESNLQTRSSHLGSTFCDGGTEDLYFFLNVKKKNNKKFFYSGIRTKISPDVKVYETLCYLQYPTLAQSAFLTRGLTCSDTDT